MVTASVVIFHTPINDVVKLIDCLLKSSVDCLFIIDNSSNDLLRIVEDKSDCIRYIHNANIGYGGGHNIAIRESISLNAKYHIVINPDIYFDTDVPKNLMTFMDQNNGCGLVMPKICYPNGDIQYLCKLLPTPFNLIGRRFLPSKKYVEYCNWKYELRFSDYNVIMEVPSLSGCFMFLRIDILKKIGGFDERFFMYAEDLDLCRRIGEVSQTVYYPLAIAFHEYEKGSYKSRKLLRYHIVSIIRYFNKWGWLFDSKRKVINEKTVKEIRKKMNVGICL